MVASWRKLRGRSSGTLGAEALPFTFGLLLDNMLKIIAS